MDTAVGTVTVSGVVAAVIYSNPENGYAVVRLRDEDKSPDMPLEKDKPLLCVGTIPMAAAGQQLFCEGIWQEDPRYGMQFRTESCSVSDPSDLSGIFAYLSGGTIKGIGEATARLLVDRFGQETLDVLEMQPERLTEIRGITPEKAKYFSAQFRERAALRRLMEFLTEWKVRTVTALRLYRNYGENAMEIVQQDPYIIATPQIGGTFREADTLALNTGFERDCPERIRAACIYELTHNLNNGHCFIPYGNLVRAAAQLIGVDPDRVPPCLKELTEEGRIIKDGTFVQEPEKEACYLPELYEAETYVAERLTEMTREKRAKREKPGTASSELSLDTVAAIDRLETQLGIRYAEEQRKTLHSALTERLLIITGGPGTGKTTTVRGILSLYEMAGIKYVLTAPTGRAAKRMSELSGREAVTVHRLLEAKRPDGPAAAEFARNEKNPLDCDAVILDETSMVDMLLMAALLKAVPKHARLICVGDVDQLPPVGPGRVFAAMIRSGMIKTVRLTAIFRQAEGSMIVKNAHMINRGEMPELGKNTGDFFRLSRAENQAAADTVAELCAVRLPQRMHIPVQNIQVLTPTRKGALGTVSLNRLLQSALNPENEKKKQLPCGDRILREGDRVMQIRNNYDILWRSADNTGNGSGLFNGDIGTVLSISSGQETMEIDFDGKIATYPFGCLSELEHAWAVTVHKSQGSEFPAVILALSSVSPLLLTRSILYTAVTRARDLLILVGTDETAGIMIRGEHVAARYSYLRQRILRCADSGLEKL